MLSFADRPRELAADVKIVNVHDPALRELYGADFALIRPDQIVAWRGNDAQAGLRALEYLRG